MKLSIPESRQSVRWIRFLDKNILEAITLVNGAFIIDIDAIEVTGPTMQALVNRLIQEATVKFGAERL